MRSLRSIGSAIYLAASCSLLVGISGARGVAAQDTAAVVVVGLDEDSSITEPLRGAAQARGYSPLATEAVEAATVRTLGAQAPSAANAEALRTVLDASTLFLLTVHPAEGDELPFVLERFDAGGVSSAEGRAARADLVAAIVGQLVALDANSASTGESAPIVRVAPAQSPPRSAMAGPQVQPQVAHPQADPHPQAGVRPQYAPPQQGPAQPLIDLHVPERDSGFRGWSPIGAVALVAGIVTWVLMPTVGSAVVCDSDHTRECRPTIWTGLIPIAGPWMTLAEPPNPGWSADEERFFIAMGIVQGIGWPLGIVGLILGKVRRVTNRVAASTPSILNVSLEPLVLPNGGGLSLRGTF